MPSCHHEMADFLVSIILDTVIVTTSDKTYWALWAKLTTTTSHLHILKRNSIGSRNLQNSKPNKTKINLPLDYKSVDSLFLCFLSFYSQKVICLLKLQVSIPLWLLVCCCDCYDRQHQSGWQQLTQLVCLLSHLQYCLWFDLI